MLYRYLNHIKSRPEHHRRRYALGISALITAGIAIVWLSIILPHGVSEVVAQKETNTSTQGDTPMVTLQRGVAQAFEAMQGIFKGATDKSLNLQSEYDKMKNQVQSGEIKMVPQNSVDGY